MQSRLDPPAEARTAVPRRHWLETFQRVRTWTERLCQPLEIEDYVLHTVVETGPLKWRLAHVSWFFETFLLSLFLPGYRPFHPRFDYLFNSYYQPLDSGNFYPHERWQFKGLRLAVDAG